MTRAARILLASSWVIVALAACGEPRPASTAASEEVPTPYDTSLSAQALAELAEYCSALIDSNDPYFGTHQRAKFIDDVKNAGERSSAAYVLARLALAQDHLRFGEVGQAVTPLKEALDQPEPGGPGEDFRAALLEALAVTYLKMGELDNCLSPAGALICTLPLDRTVVQTNTLGSSEAIEYLLQLLELEPDNVKARWLLNIAHMTLGTYPDQVPDSHLIPPDALGSGHQIGRFQNIAHTVGLYTLDLAGGSIVEDFDGDGLLDIMTSTSEPCESLRYFHNDGNGLFSDYTSRAGLKGQLGGLNMVQADYDDDGRMDVLVIRGGWLLEGGQIRNSLLRNNDDGTFTDVTHQAGLATPAYPSQSAAWADFDNDGDLDLFACNESMPALDDPDTIVFPIQLFRNNGDGTFVDVAAPAGVTNLRYCKGSIWGDFDRDGDPDLYVSNFVDDNRLYRNNADGTFTDVAPLLGVEEPYRSLATWFWDYDNDGKGFVDVTFSGGGHLQKGHGISFGDLDRDGDQDIFAQIGGTYPGDAASNALYENPGHGNRWISVRLIGVESNRAAIGARIKVEIATKGGNRVVYSHVNSGGSFGASSMEQEIGLGQAENIISLEVYWPTSDTVQVFEDLPLDVQLEIREGRDEFKTVDSRQFRFRR